MARQGLFDDSGVEFECSNMEIYMDERDSLIAVNLSILHWDNGCRKCPLIEECIKADNDKECQDIWYDWLKEQNK